jgi:hypothetical protein
VLQEYALAHPVAAPYYIDLERNRFWAELTTATYNLVRMAGIETMVA